MPGRKKKPSALAIIQGNPGKRPLNKKEPKLKAEAPRCPAILSDVAKKHWKVIVKQLEAAKVMTKLDSDALAMYCEAYARWLDANEQLTVNGMITYTDKGYPIQSPYIAISNKAFDQMKGMLVEFGMTPSSRTKVNAIDDKKQPDGWGDI